MIYVLCYLNDLYRVTNEICITDQKAACKGRMGLHLIVALPVLTVMQGSAILHSICRSQQAPASTTQTLSTCFTGLTKHGRHCTGHDCSSFSLVLHLSSRGVSAIVLELFSYQWN